MGVLAILLAMACGPSPSAIPLPARAQPEPNAPPALPTPAPATSDAPAPEAEAEARERVMRMVERVSLARGLPARRAVASRVLDRTQLIERIRKHVDAEMPQEVLDYDGELLAALELVPPGYDAVKGIYTLLQGRIAGFYEPADQTMYLADDLGEEEAEETLAHELVHALQDQAYPLASILKYVPGDSDRLTAAHALIEGDATSAMLDVVAGSAFNVSEGMLRTLLAASTALSAEGATTPHVLQAMLTAPYSDGFTFVQERRKAGGWPAVDAVFRALPDSTEQLLHPDKLAKREPPIAVPAPPLAALGSGFRSVFEDVLGEQGLRTALEEWTPREKAVRAAAGWGGDRYVVARRDAGGASVGHEIAAALRIVFDTARDAEELAAVLKARFGERCRERPALGPFAWRRRGARVTIVAGPFEREDKTRATKSTGTCATATAFADALLSFR